ncbi:MAG: phosphoribosylamine--glycine ligase [candidate division WOR-3 bacterium]
MKVLLVGSGGREHAMAWKISQSPLLSELLMAPGNPGMARLGNCIPVPAADIPELVALANREKVDLVVVGPESPIAMGIANRLEKLGIPVFAPRSDAAQLEASKVWAKSFMRRNRIPTAGFEVFSDFEEAKEYVYEACEYPCVIKADGLAAGKGVFVVKSKSEALLALDTIMVKAKFGTSGREVVIEDFLKGRELSVFVASDGYAHRFIGWAVDYKQLKDNDQGPNTGGMGTISPVPFLGKDDLERIEREVIQPTFEALRREGILYRGILYFGLMWTDDGPFVLEYNVRMGDPEAQAVLPLMENDFLEICVAGTRESMHQIEFLSPKGASCCVVLASEGYPDSLVTGRVIMGAEIANEMEGINVFHAGTREEGGKLLTDGGRVLSVVGVGNNPEEARARAYEAVSKISFEGMQFRKDIGSPGRFQ